MANNDPLRAVINRDERLLRLHYYDPSDKPQGNQRRMPKNLALLPGLNFVRASELDLVKFDETADKSAGRVSLIDIANVSEYDAKALASATNSRASLVAWLAMEKRDSVKLAITKRINDIADRSRP